MRKKSAEPVRPSALSGILVALLVIAALTAAALLARREFAPGPAADQSASIGPAAADLLISEHGELFGGTPRPLNPDEAFEVLRNTAYVVGYSESRRDPLWVAYHLAATSNTVAPPRPKGFLPDDRTTAHVESRDFDHSGYDRGHMCPNHAIAIHFGAAAQEETFKMSNVVPQKHALNAGIWEDLERQESDTYPNEFGQVWIIDGPIFHEPVRSLDTGVAIPDACYKMIVRLDRGRPHVLAVIIPQTVGRDRVIDHYLTTVNEIQQETHLAFFTALPATERQEIENGQPSSKW